MILMTVLLLVVAKTTITSPLMLWLRMSHGVDADVMLNRHLFSSSWSSSSTVVTIIPCRIVQSFHGMQP